MRMKNILNIISLYYEALKQERKTINAIRRDVNLKILYKKDTGIVLGCFTSSISNKKPTLSWKNVQVLVKQKNGDVKNFFRKVYKESKARKISPQEYLDELIASIPKLEGGFWKAKNKYGTELKWLKQTREEMFTKIDDFINKGKPAYKRLDDVGGDWNAINKKQQDLLSDSLEAEVAKEFLKHDELTSFANNVFGKNSKGQFKEVLGDIDVGVSKYHIEVKFNVSGTTKSSKFKNQFKKYLDETTQKYINVEGKPVVLFIKQFTNGGSVNQSVLQTLKSQGVIILTELDQIKKLY